MKAAYNGHMEVCKLLFEHGADPNRTDEVRVSHLSKLMLLGSNV